MQVTEFLSQTKVTEVGPWQRRKELKDEREQAEGAVGWKIFERPRKPDP
jgi:hypothetical protein